MSDTADFTVGYSSATFLPQLQNSCQSSQDQCAVENEIKSNSTGLLEAERLSPEEKESLQNFYNRTLANIDSLRFPVALSVPDPYNGGLSLENSVSFSASLPQEIPYVERMTPEDRKSYPEFTRFVSNLKDIEYKDKTVWAAMKKWGSFKTDVDLGKALSGKSGPKIRFAEFNHSGPAKYNSKKHHFYKQGICKSF